MTPSEFSRIARDNGLTRKELVKLSLCQSEIYHGIRFGNLADAPDSHFAMGSLRTAEQNTLARLAKKGFIDIDDNHQVKVTTLGWTVPCNAGASIYIGGCSDLDVIEGDCLEPITRFGPKQSRDHSVIACISM